MTTQADAQTNNDDNQEEEKSFSELMGEEIENFTDKNDTSDEESSDDDAGEGDSADGEQGTEDSDEYYPASTDDDGDEEGEKEDAVDGDEKDEEGQEGDDTDPDLEVPEGISEAASERFQKLANNNKELTTKMAEVQGQFDQLEQFVNSSQATPEEFTQLVQVSRMAKSGDIQERQQAYNMALQFAHSLAPTIGKSTGANPLEGFPDIQQKVDDLEIDEASAQELANARRYQQAQENDRQSQAQQSHQSNTQAVVAQQAQVELNSLFQAWTQEPGWQSKEGLVNKFAQGLTEQVLRGAVHPSAVPGLMQQQYNSINAQMKKMTTDKRRKQAGNQSLRPSGSSGKGVETEPKNFQDGMMAAMDKVQGINS